MAVRNKYDFYELLLFYGARCLGEELRGDTPAELAVRYKVPLDLATQWCLALSAAGFYQHAEHQPLVGYLTPSGEKALRRMTGN